ncbi:hypothetical protein HDU98_006020 [Podochytrium sp. JEL0797]|nr:hypothetical protein HDU98_006020 [Podochytrium sp. JEL0797]
MVRVNNNQSAGGNSSLTFGDDSPTNRPLSPTSTRSPRSPVLQYQTLNNSRPTSPAPSLPSRSPSALGRSRNGAGNATQSSISFGGDTPRNNESAAVVASKSSFYRDEVPTPHRAVSVSKPGPSVNNEDISAVNTVARLESLVLEMQSKLDAQTDLLREMFSYVKRIDQDVGAVGDEVALMKKRMDRLVPPGGHSNFSFGGDAPTAAPPKTSVRSSPLIHEPIPSTLPSATRKLGSVHQSSIRFGDDGGSPIPDSVISPVKKANAARSTSSNVFSSADDSPPIAPAATRSTVASATPQGIEAKPATKRLFHPSTTTSTQEAEFKPSRRQPSINKNLQSSSIVLGTEQLSLNGEEDNFGVRKHRNGVKQVRPQEGVKSVGEFSGSGGLEVKEERMRLDPAELEVAGSRTGKHGVY